MTSAASAPALYAATRHPCLVPTTGKYWGLRYGSWCALRVDSLPMTGGTGSITYAPIDKRGYPYTKSCALQDCQALFGPVKSWGAHPPSVPKTRLLALGVAEYYLKGYRRPRKPSRVLRHTTARPAPATGVPV